MQTFEHKGKKYRRSSATYWECYIPENPLRYAHYRYLTPWRYVKLVNELETAFQTAQAGGQRG